MSEKTVLITGCTSGIGMETALYLYEKGYKLLLTGRNEEKLKEVSEKTGNAPYYVLDLEETEKISGLADFCRENSLHLAGMVHSAGYAPTPVNIRNYDIEAAGKQMIIHYLAFIELCKCLYSKRILEDGGSIVAMSSMSAVCKVKGATLYASAKSALNTAVQIAATEFVKRKIRVNALMPANVDTRMIAPIKDYIDEWQPWGVIPPRDIAYSVEFLLSDKSKYITGALIPISAGMIC